MKSRKQTAARIPGWISSVLMIILTTIWTYWGIGEMYHEGWWGAWYNRLPYLVPIAAMLIPALVSFRWPIVGGSLIIAIGIFALFFFGNDVAIIGLAVALVGTGFVVDGIVRRRSGPDASAAPLPWWRRRWRHLLLIGAPLIVVIGMSAYSLPIVLTRVDDGDRSAQLIEGNDVSLIWAPEGPGWNWKQPWGGYPSWHSLALYGVSPVGLDDKPGYGRQGEEIVFASGEDMARTNLCLYLSADGTELLDEPQNIWRMPTTDEMVRSLVRHGEPAGCTWQGEDREQVTCDVLPDKESPLWSTDQPVIYYWTADSYDERQGAFVSYNGWVNATYKLGGNPRHGYRCVREP